MDDEFDMTGDEGEEVAVCPECFRPCGRLDYYCGHCGGNEVINPVASYMPFFSIRFVVGLVGKVWRRFVGGQARPIWRRVFDLVVVLYYFPPILLALPFVVYSKWRKGKFRDLGRILLCVFIVVVIVVLWCVMFLVNEGFFSH